MITSKELAMDGKKIAKKAAGVTLISVSVATQVAKLGLHVADVVLSGAVHLAGQFVKGSDHNIGKTIASDMQKGLGKLSDACRKKGKEFMR